MHKTLCPTNLEPKFFVWPKPIPGRTVNSAIMLRILSTKTRKFYPRSKYRQNRTGDRPFYQQFSRIFLYSMSLIDYTADSSPRYTSPKEVKFSSIGLYCRSECFRGPGWLMIKIFSMRRAYRNSGR